MKTHGLQSKVNSLITEKKIISFLKIKVYMKERKTMFMNEFQQKYENLRIK